MKPSQALSGGKVSQPLSVGKVSQPLSGGKRPKKPCGTSDEPPRKKTHFIEAVEPTDEHYAAPVVTIEKPGPSGSTSNMKNPEQELATTEVMDFFALKLREVTSVQEQQFKRLSKENNLLRQRLLELMAEGTGREVSKAKKLIIRPKRVPGPAIDFQGNDLMQYEPSSEGPSVFGRFLATVLFGVEQSCMLINHRLGVKVDRKNCRQKVPEDLEFLFIDVIHPNYSDNTEKALKEAMNGANQYGLEMKVKYGSLVDLSTN